VILACIPHGEIPIESIHTYTSLAFTDSKSYSPLSVFSPFPLSYREMVA
jgi:hypothetical protein